MSEYAARFAENRIDVSVLRDLTDQDLKDLGVVLGDRRKILRAIAALDETLAGAAGIDFDRADDLGHRRTPPSHCDVLGPRWLNGAFGPHGP